MSNIFKDKSRKAAGWRERLIKSYLQSLQNADPEKTLEFFTSNASVVSPLYGKVKAVTFYPDLFEDTSNSNITLLDIYLGNGKPPKAAAHFFYNWKLKWGSQVGFWCVDIFRFHNQSKRISELTIIYDTVEAREVFNRLKK